MDGYVLGFEAIDQTQVAVVGGKGARLGELSRIEGVSVPNGFCITTRAFQRAMATASSMDERLDRLSLEKPDDRATIRARSAEIRRTLESIAIPDDVAAAITRALAQFGEQAAYAVRSATTFHEAGGRVFVDVSRALASPAGRAGLLSMAGKSDPLTGDALQTVIDRGFIPSLPDQEAGGPATDSGQRPKGPAPIATDPGIVAELIGRSEASLAALKRDILGKSGPALLDFILADFQEFKRILFDPGRCHPPAPGRGLVPAARRR